ncbi:MAG: lipocalin family protein [Capnocytophaga sp.]|nr:lipocalin family protein [Capnocytophaga sp.]
MKKVFSMALLATAMFLSSCGKDDDNTSNTSLTGDWYGYVLYADENNKGMRWSVPNTCSEQSYWSIADKKIKLESYLLDNNNNCQYNPIYYDYTSSNGTFHMTISNDSPTGKKGNTSSVKYEMKDKELILRYYDGTNNIITVRHKKGVDYSHLDPFIGRWIMTKYVVGQQEVLVKDGECLYGEIVAHSLGATLYLNYPENGQCNKTINTYQWVKEGGTYYNTSDPNNKEQWDVSFSNNNRSMTFGVNTTNGYVVMHFTKLL